jgi:hypothetical protein
MSVFTFGEKTIKFSEDVEFYAPYVNEFVEISFSSGIRFSKRLESCKTIEDVLNHAPNWAQDEIDNAILHGVDILIENGIIEYDCDRIKSYKEGRFDISCSSEYDDLFQQYKAIVNAEKAYNNQKAYERSNRSRYQGYGFGVGAQFKARVQAGAMNMVTDAFRGVGDSAVDAVDKSDFNRQKKALCSDENLNKLVIVIMNYVDDIGLIIRELLQKYTGKGATEALFKEQRKANAIFENLQRLDSNDQKKEYLRQIIIMNPFQWEYMEYLLVNYMDLGIPFCDVKRMAVFLNEYATRRWEQNTFWAECEAVDGLIPSQDVYEALKCSGIEKDYIDDNYNLLPQRYDFTEDMPKAVVLKLTYTEIEINYVSMKNAIEKLKGCSPYELDIFYSSIKSICDKHHILDNAADLSIANEISSYAIKECGQIKELLQKLNKKYTDACTVDDIKFESLKIANLYRQDLEQFSRIYSPGRSYADYESEKLRSVLEELQGLTFNTEEIQQKIMLLEDRVQTLAIHEESTAYKKGRKLLESFASIEVKGLYIYGSEEFLCFASKAKTNKTINKIETDSYPLVVYDKASGDSIKGFAITDRYFYDFGGILVFGAKSIELEKIVYLRVSNCLEIVTRDNKSYRIKFPDDELDLNLFARTMALGLQLSEDSVQIIPEGERNNGFLTEQINDVKEKILSGAKLAGVGKILKKPKTGEDKGLITVTSDNETSLLSNKAVDRNNQEFEDRFCSNCGAPINQMAKYCMKCGQKLF